jgi:hypothetical protein
MLTSKIHRPVLSSVVEDYVGFSLPLPALGGLVAALIALSALYNLVTRGNKAVQLLAAAAIAGAFFAINQTLIGSGEFKDISESYKGKENKEVREEKSAEQLTLIKDQNVLLLAILSAGIVLQLVAARSSAKAAPTSSDNEKKKQ